MSTVEFRDVEKTFSQVLTEMASTLPEGKIQVRDLLTRVGEHGFLLFCMILTIPFLTPLPLPGVSTVFGLLIMFVSLGVILNRVPWMPRQLLGLQVSSSQLAPVLRRGSQVFARVEKFIRPRLLLLTHGAAISRVNGIILFIGGVLLILPLPFIPFSNFLPGWGILLLAAGIMQRDGLFILIGYILNLVTVVYFGALAIGFVAAGGSLIKFLSGLILILS